MCRLLVLAPAVASVAMACGSTPSRPDPTALTRVQLDGVAGLPALDIEVPAFMRPVTGAVPDMYLLAGGSLSKGLLADVAIGASPPPGVESARLRPACLGTVTQATIAGHPSEVCDWPRGRATTVHYADGDLVCRVSWRTEERARWSTVIAALDAACGSVRRR